MEARTKSERSDGAARARTANRGLSQSAQTGAVKGLAQTLQARSAEHPRRRNSSLAERNTPVIQPLGWAIVSGGPVGVKCPPIDSVNTGDFSSSESPHREAQDHDKGRGRGARAAARSGCARCRDPGLRADDFASNRLCPVHERPRSRRQRFAGNKRLRRAAWMQRI